jgi:hypothetical protein
MSGEKSIHLKKNWVSKNNFFLFPSIFIQKCYCFFLFIPRSLLFLSFSLYLHELKCSQNVEKIFFFYDYEKQILQYTLYIYYYNVTFFSFLINHFISKKRIYITYVCFLNIKAKKHEQIFFLPFSHFLLFFFIS